MNATSALELTTWIGALSAIQIGLGTLSQANLFRHEQAWSVLRLRKSKQRTPNLTRMLTPIVTYPGMVWQCTLRIFLAGLLLVPQFGAAVDATAAAGLTGLMLLWKWRQGPSCVSGFDHMHLLLWTSLTMVFISKAWFPDPKLIPYCTGFLTAMVLLSYAVAGFIKVISPVWQQGRFLQLLRESGVMEDTTFSRILGKRPWSLLAAWAVIISECAAPLILLLPTNGVIAALSGLFLFHVLNTRLLAVHDFPLTWLSFYPSVLFTASRLL